MGAAETQVDQFVERARSWGDRYPASKEYTPANYTLGSLSASLSSFCSDFAIAICEVPLWDEPFFVI